MSFEPLVPLVLFRLLLRNLLLYLSCCLPCTLVSQCDVTWRYRDLSWEVEIGSGLEGAFAVGV